MDPYIAPDALDPAHPRTPGKLECYQQACDAYAARSEVVGVQPAKLILQTTDRCNLRCPHCQLPRPRGTFQMSLGLMERIAVELFPGLIELHPTNLGEPLCWPHFRRLCRRMDEEGVLLDLTTNGTLLSAERLEWIAPIARDIKVSFDGATGPTFQRYRRGADFEAVCANVSALVARLRKVKTRRPVVALQMTLMKGNFQELPALVRLGAELGVDRVKAYHLFSFSSGWDQESLLSDLDAYEAVLKEALATGEDQDVDLQIAEPPLAAGSPVDLAPYVCHLPWHESWIDFDGAIVPCHSHGGQVAGNITRSTFAQIWDGPLYRQIRSAFASGTPGWHCRGCGMNFEKRQEHEPVPYDPLSFLHDRRPGADRYAHPSGVRWSGRMRPFDLRGRRLELEP